MVTGIINWQLDWGSLCKLKQWRSTSKAGDTSTASTSTSSTESAVYMHSDGTRERVSMVKRHQQGEGGGVTIFIPSLQRERQTVEERLSEHKIEEGAAGAEAQEGGRSREGANALEGGQEETKELVERQLDLPTARSMLLREFKRITLATLVQEGPCPARTVGALVQVSAIDDHYVVKEEGQQLFNTLVKTVVHTGGVNGKVEADVRKVGEKRAHGDQEQRSDAAVLHWVGGGHASSFIQTSKYFIPAICQAFDMLEDQGDADTAAGRALKRQRT
jgi:hypothetical protein